MVPDENGVWCWQEGLNKFQEIRADWNKFVGQYNATVSPRNMGRPLQASKAQRQRALAKHASGQSRSSSPSSAGNPATSWWCAQDRFSRRRENSILSATDLALAKHASGQSLRSIAEEMELGLQTVRTILDKKDGVDRATLSRLQRIAPDKIAEARARRSSKEIAALPKRINANLKRNADLLKQAKGLR